MVYNYVMENKILIEPYREVVRALEKPRNFRVILLDDDYTPMDFVVEILKKFFGYADNNAVDIMLQVHTQGKGSCGLYTRDIAQTRVVQVNEYSRAQEYPLKCIMEPE